MNMLPKNIRLHICIWISTILLFSIVALLLILRASGYVINLKAKTLEKTGLITLSSDPKGALLFVNGKLKEKTPSKLDYLKPGLYHLKVEKDGYQSWEKTERIEAGQYIKEQAVMFLKNPEIIDTTLYTHDDLLNTSKTSVSEEIQKSLPQDAQDLAWNKSKDTLLYKTEYEIWLFFPQKQGSEKNKIIARFTNPVLRVGFYSDYAHILFVNSGQLRIIELDGGNDTELFDINSIEFQTISGGKEIIFLDADKVKLAKVR